MEYFDQRFNSMYNFLYEGHHSILYLTKFGSHLYGTNTKESDLDIKGLFLPSKQSCYLNNAPKHWSDRNEEEDEEDFEIQLWSIQYFRDLLAKGDTNALDLLFSFTSPKTALCYPYFMRALFERHAELFSQKHLKGYLGYIISQAKKYGIKTSRFRVIERVRQVLDELSFYSDDRLSNYFVYIAYKAEDSDLCYTSTDKNGNEFLYLGGSLHQFSISMGEFVTRVKREYEKYGDRTKKAAQEEGRDYKALSHAVRAVCQLNELDENGIIHFPLKDAEFIRCVKLGQESWETIEEFLAQGLEKHLEKDEHHEKFSPKVMDDFIINLYRREE